VVALLGRGAAAAGVTALLQPCEVDR